MYLIKSGDKALHGHPLECPRWVKFYKTATIQSYGNKINSYKSFRANIRCSL